MAIVKKSNVELIVAEDRVEEYLEMGYSLLDDDGKVVRKKKSPTELFIELQEKCINLENENKALKETISKLTNDTNASTASHSSSNEVSEDNPSNNPHKRKKSNKGD